MQTWPTSIDNLLPILDYNIRHGRTYLYDKNPPLFPFGHGLTYTTFNYSNLKTQKPTVKEGETVNVTFTLENTGNFDSDEVAQVYVSFPESKVERPAIALKGFKRVAVAKGKSMEVTIPVNTDELKYWDVDKHAFVLEKGKVNIAVGASSADLRLNGSIVVL
ncbi:MAG TPA: fibronectin type III-like domain-contianing protein [Prolixibacteraceae bacterium]|nr:fibronectin type III-like domain-contianing protein [Prolixibacteraceae bacterium]